MSGALTPLPFAPSPLGRRIRVTFLIDELRVWTAGTERHLLTINAALDTETFEREVCVFSTPPAGAAEALRAAVHVVGPAHGGKISRLQLLRSLMARFRETKPDIVQTFFPGAHLYGTLAAWWTGVPVIVASRRDTGYWRGPSYALTRPLVNRAVDVWQCNSRAAAESVLSEGVPASRIQLLPNAIDCRRFAPASSQERAELRKQLGLPANSTVFVAVANLRPVKSPGTLVEAAALLLRRHSDVYFVLVGSGPLREVLTARARELRIAEALRFLGEQPEVAPYVRAADAGVLSSLSEGSSNALLEYMAAGLPVVVSDVGGNRELVDGLFFKPGNAEEFAEKMKYLIDNPQEAEAFGRRNRQRASAQSEDIVARTARQSYVKLVERLHSRL